MVRYLFFDFVYISKYESELRAISRELHDNLDILAHIFENTLIFCPSGYIYISEGRNQATSVQRQDIRI